MAVIKSRQLGDVEDSWRKSFEWDRASPEANLAATALRTVPHEVIGDASGMIDGPRRGVLID